MGGVEIRFAKGHGTGNDFVVVPDADGDLKLSEDDVVALCDRRRGLGGDGVLRVVRTAAVPEVAGQAHLADWFMDYRNADGSLAEMCGNGVRVFARYLADAGLVDGPTVAILTRAGRVVASISADRVAVDMPVPDVGGTTGVRLAGAEYTGTIATCGNPNVVCRVDDPATLDLVGVPEFDRVALPGAANVEFIASTPPAWIRSGVPSRGAEAESLPQHVRMRVVERGVGETLSCGSGACAVAAVVLRDAGLDAGSVTIDVPGGRLAVTIGDGRCVLEGPAVIVATGTVTV